MLSNVTKRTITTLEIAEMMEVSHSDVLRKLDGRKDRKGYIAILAESQMAVSDFFIQTTYRDSSGKENKCYKVTKLGCDFLANKYTGEKGVLFTARYVKRFDEMENNINKAILLDAAIAGNVADLGRVTERIMRGQGSAPYKIAEAFKMECSQFGIILPADFVKVPVYEQMQLNFTKEKE